jgi:hypothetical protein
MAISATYQQLQEKIADDLGARTDLLSAPSDESALTTSPIQDAIQSAIAKWEREPFYFNQTYGTLFTTVAGQEFYTSSDAAAIATSPDLIKLQVTISGQRYPITPRTWQYIADISANASVTGQPCDYAYFAERIRLYPIPDGAYTVTQSGTQRLTALSANSDTNAWTQDAYDLIRSEAKLILALEVLHDADLAARMQRAIYGDPTNPRIRGYLYPLQAETARRSGRGRVRPTHF